MSPALEHCSQDEEGCVNTAGAKALLPSGVWQSLRGSRPAEGFAFH